jgi:uncharacterized membrane protein
MAADLAVLVHILSILYMVGGLGAVMVPLWRGWQETDLVRQAADFEAAAAGEAAGLLPGAILALFAGFLALAVEGLNPIGTGWLLAKIVLHLFVLFVCLPLLHAGLQRVRLAAAEAVAAGEATEDLRNALADNVPRVFSGLIAVILLVMAALAVLKPF